LIAALFHYPVLDGHLIGSENPDSKNSRPIQR
jgi:hypothetical protein